MDRQHIVCLVIGFACVNLPTLVAQPIGLPAALVLVVAFVALKLHEQPCATKLVARPQVEHARAPARRRRRALG